MCTKIYIKIDRATATRKRQGQEQCDTKKGDLPDFQCLTQFQVSKAAKLFFANLECIVLMTVLISTSVRRIMTWD